MTVAVGVVADDITGACDVAAGVAQVGMPVEVRLGVPDAGDVPDAPYVVVALKSRTVPAAEAVAESTAAAHVLRAWGATTVYQKYCSTFDSTDQGNIGPVADALIDQIGETAVAVGTPVTPAAGRTMHRGHLFVGNCLLSESSLARHPLTPMTDPDLVRVLARQTPRSVSGIPIEVVRAGTHELSRRIDDLRTRGSRHVLVDAVDEHDLDVLAAVVDGLPDSVVGGAAGLVTALARRHARGTAPEVGSPPAGGRLLLSGSGSDRTRAQVAAFDGDVHVVDPDEAVERPDTTVAAALGVVARSPLVLVSATTDPESVARTQQRWGVGASASALEHVLGRIAAGAVRSCGVRSILVAGGETSGAVAHALGVRRLRVRRVVSVGVPWMSAMDGEDRALDLCFKSGNFGDVGLFREAWKEPSR